jgi:FixJ family two-component response regulator
MADNQPCEIAVVDDDTAILDSYRFMLELAGFQVVTYPSASEFLASDHERTGRLILDHNMPIMTGLELTARLRSQGNTVPIMLVTSSPSPAIVARALELGVLRILEKPPTEADLIQFVTGCG